MSQIRAKMIESAAKKNASITPTRSQFSSDRLRPRANWGKVSSRCFNSFNKLGELSRAFEISISHAVMEQRYQRADRWMALLALHFGTLSAKIAINEIP